MQPPLTESCIGTCDSKVIVLDHAKSTAQKATIDLWQGHEIICADSASTPKNLLGDAGVSVLEASFSNLADIHKWVRTKNHDVQYDTCTKSISERVSIEMHIVLRSLQSWVSGPGSFKEGRLETEKSCLSPLTKLVSCP